MRKPTSADVARHANVSRATVSYVLNDVAGQRIPDNTRELVRAAAAELGYRPNLSARNLAAGSSGTAVFVVPPVVLGALATTLGHLSDRLAQTGTTLAMEFDSGDADRLLKMVDTLQAGAVISMFELPNDVTVQLTEAGARVRWIYAVSQPEQLADPVGALQVEHLLGRGHRRIAFADTFEERLRPLADGRYQGVVSRIASGGQHSDVPRQALRVDREWNDSVIRSWHSAGVTAICAYNDTIALAVISSLRRLGLTCPTDVAVIGVDDTDLGQLSDPALTSIAFDGTALAEDQADRIAESLRTPELTSRVPVVRSSLRVQEREST